MVGPPYHPVPVKSIEKRKVRFTLTPNSKLNLIKT